jgi:hypothetical protein
LIVHIKQLKNQTEKFKSNDYRLLKKYDVIEVSQKEKLIVPVTQPYSTFFLFEPHIIFYNILWPASQNERIGN